MPNRGVIIDLDMAIELDCTSNLRDTDSKAVSYLVYFLASEFYCRLQGTRAFQSINVLTSYIPGNKARPRSYMDDLESFFYVLCWICFGYDGPGKRIGHFKSTFSKWVDRRPDEGRMIKIYLFYFFRDYTDFIVTDYFGDIFLDLVDSLHRFFGFYLTIDRVLGARPAPPTLDEALATILPIINIAIAAVEAEEATESSASPKTDTARTPAESSDGESSTSSATKKLRRESNALYHPSSLNSTALAVDEA